MAGLAPCFAVVCAVACAARTPRTPALRGRGGDVQRTGEREGPGSASRLGSHNQRTSAVPCAAACVRCIKIKGKWRGVRVGESRV